MVVRPDLSQRTALSKSALVQFDLCQTKSWFAIHDPKPFVPKPKVTFGSAVDAAVEVLISYARSGQTPDWVRAMNSADEVIIRDGLSADAVGYEEVGEAVHAFVRDVLPQFDWSYCRTQASITEDLDELGETNGHPDIILADNRVYDVKTAARAKDLPSVELGLYALLVEAETGKPVPAVGYMTWVRTKMPRWQVIEAPVTDEMRRWAYEHAAAYVRARKADALLNAKAERAANYSMTGGPKFDGLCGDCEWAPANGGPCLIAKEEGGSR